MNTALMAPRKKKNTKGAAIAQAILEQYQPQTKEDIASAKTAQKEIILEPGKPQKIQLDGKGKKETLELNVNPVKKKKIGEEDDGLIIIYKYTMSGELIIDGKKITKKITDREFQYLNMEAFVVDINKKDNVKDIFFAGYAGSWNGKFKFIEHYQYKNGKLSKKDDFLATLKKIGKNTSGVCKLIPECISGCATQFETTGDGKVTWEMCLKPTGSEYIHGNIQMKLKNGKLVLNGSTPTGIIKDTAEGVNITVLPEYKSKLDAYTKPNGKTKAFSMKKNEKATVEKYCIQGKKFYVQLKSEKGKIGWVEIKALDTATGLSMMGSLHI